LDLLNKMENVTLNLAYDLLLKRTKLSSTSMNAKSDDDSGYHTYFVICNSCYWYASYFNTDNLESQVILVMRVIHTMRKLYRSELANHLELKSNHIQGMKIEFFKNNNNKN
jgi:hypothetical protein